MAADQADALGLVSMLTVSGLNRLVRESLEAALPLTWVTGEISNLTYAASGHVYFSLKDSQAQVRCAMWRSRAQLLGWRLENGQKVEARVLPSFYEARGDFQLSVESLRRAGQGDLFERFLRVKAELEAEGIFDAAHKRALPAFPRHLVIITSLQAAALRDVLTALNRRAPYLRITLIPTLVQGDGAANQIANALAEAGKVPADSVILCRGGGSIEDLWSFNEPMVARAIRACPHPVISGIGHETDFTIADFAADLRAATPTAAAELACTDAASLHRQLELREHRLLHQFERQLAGKQQQLDGLAGRLQHPAQRLANQGEVVKTLAHRLRLAKARGLELKQFRLDGNSARLQHGKPALPHARIALNHLHERLAQQQKTLLAEKSAKLNLLHSSLSQLNPDAVLMRGYALVQDHRAQIVRDSACVAVGEQLFIKFARGTANVEVSKVVVVPEAD